MKLLLTGGSGFIGTNFVRYVMRHRPDDTLINLDKLTYSGNPENLTDIEQTYQDRYRFVHGDVTDPAVVEPLIEEADAIVHMAAESHVDRSIMDGRPFVETNVLGTQTLLDAMRRADPDCRKRLVHVSTDEVFGSLPLSEHTKKFDEHSPLDPSSPYAASKAGSDLLVQAYHRTFGLDVCITNCSNNFGPFQFPEKVIPLFVTNLLEGEPLPLYGDGKNVRDWLHVVDHCEALCAVLDRGRSGARYTIGGNNERSNLELAHTLLKIMDMDESMIRPVADRPGHDRRYAIDASRMQQELGWWPTRSAWPEALERTVQWYRDHPTWWQRIKTGQYLDYYKKQYGSR
jgi:dTDP-glucose 4,6-dehydratase